MNIGVVGAGNISGIYLKNLSGMFADKITLKAIADGFPEKAKEAAEKYRIDFEPSVESLLARKDIDIVLNITNPASHYPVARAALEAGKHVYNEKPLCTTLEDGKALMKLANEKGLRVGSATDTFLGAGVQTAKKLLQEGAIGKPVAAVFFMMNHGPESWHPNPDFYYDIGGGPVLDMAPYYLNTLFELLGKVTSVKSEASKSFDTRTAKDGHSISVKTPTHIQSVLDFNDGTNAVKATAIFSFDIWTHSLPHIEIYGSEGSLQIGDPNWFTSPVKICKKEDIKDGSASWHDVVLTAPAYAKPEWLTNDNWRGIGLTDMALSIEQDKPHRASGDRGLHALDVMTKMLN
ncbi:MAG: Gfo/Idh/MocA family oxidoreductase [Spirochaetaceae bacterium]|nr:Gfo/Idh/MocA family oxidoreductase [Spirochaetaceae bacterium]